MVQLPTVVLGTKEFGHNDDIVVFDGFRVLVRRPNLDAHRRTHPRGFRMKGFGVATALLLFYVSSDPLGRIIAAGILIIACQSTRGRKGFVVGGYH